MSFWDSLDPKYRLILCDIWGVVHDGVNLYPGAASRLKQWRDQGRCVELITNAPRTAEAVEAQLARIGLPRECWDYVAASGEAGIEALNALHKPVGFVGTVGDRQILEGRGVEISDADDFTEVQLDYSPGADVDVERLTQIQGQPPSLLNPPRGCRFHPRCPYVMEICKETEPELLQVSHDPAHFQRCHLDEETKDREASKLTHLGDAA